MDVTQDFSEQKPLVFSLNSELVLLDINFEACKLFRLSKKNSLGRVFREITFPIEKEIADQLIHVLDNFSKGEEYQVNVSTKKGVSYALNIEQTPEGIDLILKNQKMSKTSEAVKEEKAQVLRKDVIKKLGKYQLINQVGKGGMGKVFLALDSFENKVAIKVLLAGEFADEKDLLRFKREGYIMSRLNHRNICRIIEMGEEVGERYIAMEYIDGAELNTFIAEDGLSLDKLKQFENISNSISKTSHVPNENSRIKKILKVFLEILEGLHYAHQFEIIHRDLKPGNIMIRKTGEPVVMDFGLAKFQDPAEHAQVSMSGEVMGTMEYMAPEQTSSLSKLDVRVDVYAAAAVLYQMLTGKKKLTGSGNLYEDLSTLKESIPVCPSHHSSDIPEDLDIVVMKGLAIDPSARYDSVRQFAADIQAVIADMPIMARKDSISDKMFRWIRKHKKLSMASVVLSTIFFSMLAYHFVTLQKALTKYEEAERLKKEEKLKAHLATRELHEHIENDLVEERWMEAKMKALKILSVHPTDQKAKQIIDHADFKIMELEYPVPSHSASGFPLRIKKLKEVIQNWKKLNDYGPAEEVILKLENKLEQELILQKNFSKLYSTLNIEYDKIGPFFVNSIDLKMRYVPPGNFTMGDISLDTDHHAKISKGFFMTETEITQKQYRALVDHKDFFFKGDKLPAESLSWYETISFCEVLNQKENYESINHLSPDRNHYPKLVNIKGYRLPTEAEWEYACRADLKEHLYHWKEPSEKGMKAEPLWYVENSGVNGKNLKTHPTASFVPNPWGLYDMHGNVFEWVLDTYHHKTYSQASKQDPVNTSFEGPGIIRGGCFQDTLFSCRAGRRQALDIDQSNEKVGFRVCFIP